jgi:hypothetical protein
MTTLLEPNVIVLAFNQVAFQIRGSVDTVDPYIIFKCDDNLCYLNDHGDLFTRRNK